jgi:hypothetical protein
MYKRDYMLRVIKQIADLLAVVTRKRQEGDLDGAQRELDAGYRAILGLDTQMLRLDSRTMSTILSTRERVRGLAALVRADGELQASRGHARLAHARRLRAVELLLEARALFPDGDPECDEGLAALVPGLEPEALSARYRALLAPPAPR